MKQGGSPSTPSEGGSPLGRSLPPPLTLYWGVQGGTGMRSPSGDRPRDGREREEETCRVPVRDVGLVLPPRIHRAFFQSSHASLERENARGGDDESCIFASSDVNPLSPMSESFVRPHREWLGACAARARREACTLTRGI